MDLADWKAVDGVTLYGTRNITENGKPVSKDSVKQWTINPKVDPSLWQKPPSSAPSEEQK